MSKSFTKTSYRKYIGSADWQERRKEFLTLNNRCVRCEIPRWLAEIAYDQDLNVNHKSYANVGNEEWDDLEPLCRRCHEIDKFRRSDLRQPKSVVCENCGEKHWDPYSDSCIKCQIESRGPFICRICQQPRLDLAKTEDGDRICVVCRDLSTGNMNSLIAILNQPCSSETFDSNLRMIIGTLAVSTSVEAILDILAADKECIVESQRKIARRIAREKELELEDKKIFRF